MLKLKAIIVLKTCSSGLDSGKYQCVLQINIWFYQFLWYDNRSVSNACKMTICKNIFKTLLHLILIHNMEEIITTMHKKCVMHSTQLWNVHVKCFSVILIKEFVLQAFQKTIVFHFAHRVRVIQKSDFSFIQRIFYRKHEKSRGNITYSEVQMGPVMLLLLHVATRFISKKWIGLSLLSFNIFFSLSHAYPKLCASITSMARKIL